MLMEGNLYVYKLCNAGTARLSASLKAFKSFKNN